MVELTVGYVSGFIATGVFLAHFFVPLFLALVMVAVLRDNNSAVTWSVAARFLQSSKWPSIMRTDSSGSKGVRKPVLAVSKLQTITMFLITISSVITPLGLYEAISPNQKPVSKTFGYVKDPSPLGFGTPPRPEFATTRLCGGRGPGTVPCPGSKTVDRSTRNNTTMTIDYDLDVTVPDGLTKLYGSGMNAQSATLSSIWDIQWRQYTYDIDEDKMINKGEKYLVGATRTASTVALDNKVQLVEGLVVDTRANSSGIGFRNHSIPQGVNEGGTWSEDILWVEPETVCVDTNLTLDFTLGHDLLELIQNLRLTDRGGFANLVPHRPYIDSNDTQGNPDLRGRAYYAAWLHNGGSMLYFNVTNPKSPTRGPFAYIDSQVGKSFELAKKAGSTTPVTWDALQISPLYGEMLGLGEKAWGFGNPLTVQKNPWNVTNAEFKEITDICAGTLETTVGNASTIIVSCGLVYGAARRANGDASLVFEPNSEWTVPIHSCATAVRATVKTVEFYINGTTFNDLKVNSIATKQYPNNDSMPLWGVETSGMRLGDATPLWGMIDPALATKNVTAKRAERLYLPGHLKSTGIIPLLNGGLDYQNLPGSDFYQTALSYAYKLGKDSSLISTNDIGNIYDYSGYRNLAMYSKWQELSRTASTASQIVNLIWTDMATNLVVGTKGVSSSSTTPKLRKRDDNNPRSAPMVTEYTRSIRYNWLFAIPAFIALAFIILVTLLTFLFICIGRAGPRSIRKSLAQTSAGRIMAAALYPQHIARDSKRKDWLNSAGLRMVDFSGQMPVRGENGDGSVFVNPGGSGRGNYIPLQSAGVGRNLGQQSPFLEAKDQWSNGVSPVSSSHGQPHPGPYFPPGQVQG